MSMRAGKRTIAMIKIGKKFLKPHFCPDCHKLILLVRNIKSLRCPTCHKRYRRHRGDENAVTRSRRRYNNSAYRRARANALEKQGYCALCGATKNLTCHHAVDVKTGEWKGRHLTVLCSSCHEAWEKYVNKTRKRP